MIAPLISMALTLGTPSRRVHLELRSEVCHSIRYTIVLHAECFFGLGVTQRLLRALRLALRAPTRAQLGRLLLVARVLLLHLGLLRVIRAPPAIPSMLRLGLGLLRRLCGLLELLDLVGVLVLVLVTASRLHE